jgi:hypothetical protein
MWSHAPTVALTALLALASSTVAPAGAAQKAPQTAVLFQNVRIFDG